MISPGVMGRAADSRISPLSSQPAIPSAIFSISRASGLWADIWSNGASQGLGAGASSGLNAGHSSTTPPWPSRLVWW